MQKKLTILLITVCIISLNFKQINNSKHNISLNEKIYTQYCSSCHGEKVEAFVDRTWKHGSSKSELVASISNGYVDLGMPGWKSVISSKEIDKLADLILKNIATLEQYKITTKPSSNLFESNEMKVMLDTIATGFESPWGFVQFPDGNYLITDRAGILYFVDQNKNKTIIKNTPKVLAEGQGGMLDIKLHPNFANTDWIYLSYSKFKEENGIKLTTTAIIRGKINSNYEFVESEEIFEAQPYTKTKHHYGSRISFDKNGYLYFSVGERGMENEFPQNKENDNGKIHRLHDDGKIPKDNPFINDLKSRGSIYSYGHRNPQGLALNEESDEIWEHEHGPRGGDEVNIIKKGGNFGWPVISYGINYDGKTITNISKKEGMEQPEIYWIPSIAPSGMTFVKGDKYPAWKGNLMIGSLRFNYLNRCIIKNNKIIGQEKLLSNIGRIRNVEMGIDGYIYVSIENPGMIFRLIPK